MRVVFFGTPHFAVPSLAALLEAGVDVAAVVTQPDRPHARSHSTLVPPPVKELAQRTSIPVLQPDRPRGAEFVAALSAYHADLGVVVAYGHLIRPDIFALFRLGLVNVHASLLPRWRGAAPIQWAMLSGDANTGVAIMRIEAGLDTGAVWQTATMPIGPGDTTGSLTPALATLGAATLIATLPAIAAGKTPVPQPLDGVTLAPKVDRALARVQWHESAFSVSCRMRAMDPAPGAWSTYQGADIKLFAPTLTGSTPAEAPGTIRGDAGALTVAARDGWITIGEVQPAGKRRMPAAEWLRGIGGGEKQLV
ncbi:MAG TPA: methionyl-tRNA formyltransferase [Gemmatimonadales bacterium]|jgi:methionyl-tRNA formyltransferase|nr:methionyl-tRNA formyltransferase [Gemmatimonadales bacterium]